MEYLKLIKSKEKEIRKKMYEALSDACYGKSCIHTVELDDDEGIYVREFANENSCSGGYWNGTSTILARYDQRHSIFLKN